MISTAVATFGRQCGLRRIPLLWLLLLVQLAAGARASRVATRAWVDNRPAAVHAAHAAAAAAAASNETAAEEGKHTARVKRHTISRSRETETLATTAGEVPVSKPTLESAMASLAEKLNTKIENGCVKSEEGDLMGCESQCGCGHMEQCYPKYVMLKPTKGKDGFVSAKLNVGVCGTAMPVLILLSGALFICLLSCVVTVRMYFQWQESLAMPGDGSEAHMLMGKDNAIPAGVPGAPAASRGLFGGRAPPMNPALNINIARGSMPKAMPGGVAAASAAAKVAGAGIPMPTGASAAGTARTDPGFADQAVFADQVVPPVRFPEESVGDPYSTPSTDAVADSRGPETPQ